MLQRRISAPSALERAELIGSVVSSRWAADVDGEGRFPSESVDALCHEGLLSCAIPVVYGGGGLQLRELCAIARVLGRYCASTAMIFVVHQAMVLSIVRHHRGDALSDVLRDIADNELLVTGCGHAGDGGGPGSGAVTVLFGGHADLAVVGLQRPDDGEEVLAVFRADEIALRRQALGEGLGLRGLGWHSYSFSASVVVDRSLGESSGEVCESTLVPALSLLSRAACVGIVDSALDTAGRFIAAIGSRADGRRSVPPLRLARMRRERDAVYAGVDRCAAEFDAPGGEPGRACDDGADVLTSIVSAALDMCGTAGYQDGGEFGLGRHMRDMLGARGMIGSAVGVNIDAMTEEHVG